MESSPCVEQLPRACLPFHAWLSLPLQHTDALLTHVDVSGISCLMQLLQLHHAVTPATWQSPWWQRQQACIDAVCHAFLAALKAPVAQLAAHTVTFLCMPPYHSAFMDDSAEQLIV